ncbi:hypothetical protein ACQP04_29440 [Pseudonocardia halophobica]|uniref:hypothetical protein n=1 Tax=Pseudonocardia halophobica TaxID=29401 RepID=UPI003D8C70F6
MITAYRTPSSSVYEMVALERQWSWFGIPGSPRRLTLRGSELRADRARDVLHELHGSRQLHVSSAHLTAEHLPEILEAARAFRPQVVEGWPSSLAIFARLLREVDAVLPMQAVITSSETIGTAQRTLFAAAFGGPIVDHYGQTERVAMAGNCERGSYHVFPDYGYVELLPVGEQEWEIVATPLHNSGFILFRYRTGDVVGPAGEQSCPCGRAFPVLGPLDGRKEDYFVAADGRLVPLPHRLIKNLTGLTEVQAVQLSPGRFEFRLVPGPGFDISSVQAMVRDNVGHVVGPGQEVTFREMSHIPRTVGGKLPSTVRLDSSEDRR